MITHITLALDWKNMKNATSFILIAVLVLITTGCKHRSTEEPDTDTTSSEQSEVFETTIVITIEMDPNGINVEIDPNGINVITDPNEISIDGQILICEYKKLGIYRIIWSKKGEIEYLKKERLPHECEEKQKVTLDIIQKIKEEIALFEKEKEKVSLEISMLILKNYIEKHGAIDTNIPIDPNSEETVSTKLGGGF